MEEKWKSLEESERDEERRLVQNQHWGVNKKRQKSKAKERSERQIEPQIERDSKNRATMKWSSVSSTKLNEWKKK